MWKQFFDNMDCLAQGVDEHGQPIYIDADGNRWAGILLFGLGDLEQLCMQYGLCSYTDAAEICGWCEANRTDKPYTNLQLSAEWRPSENMSNHVVEFFGCSLHKLDSRFLSTMPNLTIK